MINDDFYISGLEISKIEESFYTENRCLGVFFLNCNQYLNKGVANEIFSDSDENNSNYIFLFKYEYLKEKGFFGFDLHKHIDTIIKKSIKIKPSKVNFYEVKNKNIRNYKLKFYKSKKNRLDKSLGLDESQNSKYIYLRYFDGSNYNKDYIFMMINNEIFIYNHNSINFFGSLKDIKKWKLNYLEYLEVEIENDENFMEHHTFGLGENDYEYQQTTRTFLSYNAIKKTNFLSNQLVIFFDRELSDLNIFDELDF